MGRTRSAAPARSRTTTSVAGPVPRRVSGPIRPGHPRPVSALPPRIHVPAPAGPPQRTTGVAERLRALPDHRWLDTLLRSRAWIWLLGVALGGIVAMQVSLLEMNAGIGRAVQETSALQHANAKLEEQVAELSGGDRIAAAAADMGLIAPDAGAVGYLEARPDLDAVRAAQNMTAPSDAARLLMTGSGGAPAGTAPATGTGTGVAAPAADPAGTTTTTTTTTTGTGTAPAPAATTTDPAATAPAPADTSTPAGGGAGTATPVVSAPVNSAAGAVEAPTG